MARRDRMMGDPGRILALSGHEGVCGDPGISFEGSILSFNGRVMAPGAGVELVASDDSCEESLVSGQTQVVGTWVHVAADRVWLEHLPPPGGEKFLMVGCAIDA